MVERDFYSETSVHDRSTSSPGTWSLDWKNGRNFLRLLYKMSIFDLQSKLLKGGYIGDYSRVSKGGYWELRL